MTPPLYGKVYADVGSKQAYSLVKISIRREVVHWLPFLKAVRMVLKRKIGHRPYCKPFYGAAYCRLDVKN